MFPIPRPVEYPTQSQFTERDPTELHSTRLERYAPENPEPTLYFAKGCWTLRHWNILDCTGREKFDRDFENLCPIHHRTQLKSTRPYRSALYSGALKEIASADTVLYLPRTFREHTAPF